MNTILSVFVIASLLFGGGATVNAAQNDLPNEPLYGVKILSEDVGLRFQNDPQEKVSDLMALVQTRVQEMTRLIDSGQTPPESVELRLEQHIQQALQICTTMDDPTLEQTLLQIRDQLRQRDQDMDQLRIHATQDAQPILDRTRTMLQQRLHLVEDGLVNHEAFRNAARNGFRYGQDATSTPPPTQNGNGSGNGNGTQNGQPTIQPGNNGNGNGSGPNIDPGGPNLNATSSPTCTGDCTGPNNSSGENATVTQTPIRSTMITVDQALTPEAITTHLVEVVPAAVGREAMTQAAKGSRHGLLPKLRLQPLIARIVTDC